MTQPRTAGAVEEVEIQGHIIDSLLLPKVLDEILTHGGSFSLKDIKIGERQAIPATSASKFVDLVSKCSKKYWMSSMITALCQP